MKEPTLATVFAPNGNQLVKFTGSQAVNSAVQYIFSHWDKPMLTGFQRKKGSYQIETPSGALLGQLVLYYDYSHIQFKCI